MLNSIWLATLFTFITALAWLRLNDFAAHRGWISSGLSRKFIHTGTGPLFVLCWLLFPDEPNARYFAALIPLVITLQFILVGFGILKDEAAVKAMSRSGDPKEILRGPLYYGIIFVIATVVYWTDTPTGIIALMLLCGGDGLADIIGRRWGKRKLPWSEGKSWLGSLAMFGGGWLFAMGIIAVFTVTQTLSGTIQNYLFAITVIAFIGTIVEALPFKDIDNLTITAATILMGTYFF